MLTSPEFAGAIAMPAPSSRYWVDRNGASVRFVCIHGTAGGTRAQDVGAWLNIQTEMAPSSVHYVIGQDGTVVQLVSEVDSAWGNGDLMPGHAVYLDSLRPTNPNYWSVSIEHCKPHSDNSDALTPAQQSASFRLVRDICRRHNIPLRKADENGGIFPHSDVDPVNRARCPGPYPWDELFAYLNGSNEATATGDDMTYSTGVPAGWHDANGVLSDGSKSVQLGVRNFVLAQGWNPANTIVREETYTSQCDPSDPHSGDGSNTLFQDACVVWQKATNRVYMVHTGAVINALSDQLAAAQSAAAKPNPAKTAKVKADVAAAQAELATAATDAAALDS